MSRRHEYGLVVEESKKEVKKEKKENDNTGELERREPPNPEPPNGGEGEEKRPEPPNPLPEATEAVKVCFTYFVDAVQQSLIK